MHNVSLNIIKFLTPFIILYVLSSCSPKEVMKPGARATLMWQAHIDHDWEKAYSFQTPSYRKNYTVKDYKGNFGDAIKWLNITHKSTKLINSKLAEVSLTLISSYSGGTVSMNVPSDFKERWQLIDNTWWHINK